MTNWQTVKPYCYIGAAAGAALPFWPLPLARPIGVRFGRPDPRPAIPVSKISIEIQTRVGCCTPTTGPRDQKLLKSRSPPASSGLVGAAARTVPAAQRGRYWWGVERAVVVEEAWDWCGRSVGKHTRPARAQFGAFMEHTG